MGIEIAALYALQVIGNHGASERTKREQQQLANYDVLYLTQLAKTNFDNNVLNQTQYGMNWVNLKVSPNKNKQEEPVKKTNITIDTTFTDLKYIADASGTVSRREDILKQHGLAKVIQLVKEYAVDGKLTLSQGIKLKQWLDEEVLKENVKREQEELFKKWLEQ
jgi:hypothetical protein